MISINKCLVLALVASLMMSAGEYSCESAVGASLGHLT